METKLKSGKNMKTTILKEYYLSLKVEDRRTFLKTVQLRTQLSHTSIYKWLNGESKILYANACIVSSICGIPVSQLFEHFKYIDNDGNSSES